MKANNRQLLRSAVLIAAMFSMLGIGLATATTPLIHVTYLVTNDADGANSGGYWALDNYTQTLTVYQTTTSGVYNVTVSDFGTWCTYPGVQSPEKGVLQTAGECGVISGGYGGNLTTSVRPVNTMQTTFGNGVLNMGGTFTSPNTITPGTTDAYTSWMNYFFPGSVTGNNWGAVFRFANGGNAWGWTYTDSNGNIWINNGTIPTKDNGYGDIVVGSANNQGSVQAIAGVVPETCSLSAVGSLNFGSIVPGGPRAAASSPVTVTDEGDVATPVLIYGSDWSSSTAGDLGSGSVGWTVYNIGATPNPTSTLTSTAASTGANLAANGGSSQFSFELSVPAAVTPATLRQTITFLSSC